MNTDDNSSQIDNSEHYSGQLMIDSTDPWGRTGPPIDHFSWLQSHPGFWNLMRHSAGLPLVDHNGIIPEEKKISELKVSKEIFSELKIKPVDVCSICHENYLDTDITIKCKECNNFFHDNCVRNWLTKSEKCSCPMCRGKWTI